MSSTSADGHNGAFDFESIEPGWRLAVIASDGLGWQHVSVHVYRGASVNAAVRRMRTPTWKEMIQIKSLFWDDEDVVIQYHPRRSEYVNNHPHVLHLWRPTHCEIPTPPSILVGVLSQE